MNYTKYERELAAQAANALENGFIWADEEEGKEFWQYVVSKLQSIASSTCEKCGQVLQEK